MWKSGRETYKNCFCRSSCRRFWGLVCVDLEAWDDMCVNQMPVCGGWRKLLETLRGLYLLCLYVCRVNQSVFWIGRGMIKASSEYKNLGDESPNSLRSKKKHGGLFGFYGWTCCVLVDCLQGDVDLLQQWTGEACFNKLALEAKQRKAEGVVLVRETLEGYISIIVAVVVLLKSHWFPVVLFYLIEHMMPLINNVSCNSRHVHSYTMSSIFLFGYRTRMCWTWDRGKWSRSRPMPIRRTPR